MFVEGDTDIVLVNSIIDGDTGSGSYGICFAEPARAVVRNLNLYGTLMDYRLYDSGSYNSASAVNGCTWPSCVAAAGVNGGKAREWDIGPDEYLE